MKRYNYESLLDERFQMVCQAIIVQEYSGLQCLPVGMPDGGRDAFTVDHARSPDVIFQVKFARNPEGIDDPVKWVTDAIDGELGKITELEVRGASKYILVTNVAGSSHLDVGRIDRVQRYMNVNLPIVAQTWWRDDLDRRLDNMFDLKMQYPDLLNGPDALRLLWQAALKGEDQERRENALNAYLAHQNEQDSTIRFKQAELLPSSLFGLFIDVPVQLPGKRKDKRDVAQLAYLAAARRIILNSTNVDGSEHGVYLRNLVVRDGVASAHGSYGAEVPIGAADLLLDPEFGSTAPYVVLEGAPGQGKSTLAQYLAQIHRVRLLQKSYKVTGLQKSHQSSPLMMPFKLELRDLASWLSGIDPWAAKTKEAHDGPRTLEGAIAAHVERYSGGIPFDVADLIRVIKSTPTLLILDALDEVADLRQRSGVVDEITHAIARLDHQASELRVLVTSRPTAVVDSPSLPSERFLYLDLAPINAELALDYTQRWATVRKIDSKDQRELSRILQDKLDSPHMAELAKNTMQLSILLSLIYLRGASLPDKRTELYDTYIDVFLNREAEKDEVVRKNRELLLDIHLYLGYYLHTRAEAERSTGRITTEELKAVLADYLRVEERSADLLDSFFLGVLERIVALVSRVQGTYEFEVQPLREYFAARYLYDTAPYSPAGRERRGTKPDRFMGIAPNPYWLNVTRFYAGCFSKGELLDLAERVCELIDDGKDSAYPRNLALRLLKDWVFSQSPKAASKVVKRVFDKYGIRWATSSRGLRRSTLTDISLSPGAGAEALLDVLWPYIVSDRPTERLEGICGLLARQPIKEEIRNRWLEELSVRDGLSRSEWLRVGEWLGVLRELSDGQLAEILRSAQTVESRREYLAAYFRGQVRIDYMPEDVRIDIADVMLNDVDSLMNHMDFGSYISVLGYLADPIHWAINVMEGGATIPVPTFRWEDGDIRASSEFLWKIEEAAEKISESIGAGNLRTSLTPWATATAMLRSTFGKSITEIEIGVTAGAIKNPHERGKGATSLFDDEFSLPHRIRAARGRGSRNAWWESQLADVTDVYDRALLFLASFAWASPNAIVQLAPQLNSLLSRMPERTQLRLLGAVARVSIYSDRATKLLPDVNISEWRDKMNAPFLCAMFGRLNGGQRAVLVNERMRHELGSPGVASTCLQFVTGELRSGSMSTGSAIALASDCHEAGAVSGRFLVRASNDESVVGRDKELAARLLEDPWRLPNKFLAGAYALLGRRTQRTTHVMRIAAREHWFNDEG